MGLNGGERPLLEVMLLSRNRRKALCLVRRRMSVEQAIKAALTIHPGRTFVQEAVGGREAWRERWE